MDTEWLKSTAALIGAFAALFASVAALLPHIKGNARGRRPWMLWLGLLLLVSSASVFAVRYISDKNLPLNQRLTTQAWDDYNRGDFGAAISTADDCISHFRSTGDSQEAALEKDHTPSPPTGRVSSTESSAILARGVLNDLATCFFITGDSANKLGHQQQAVEAYNATLRYGYARVFDPKGFFWSPAEVAADRLRELQK